MSLDYNDTCLDPDYFRSCLDHYQHNAVERVTEKIVEQGGYYPKMPLFDSDRDNRLNACLRVLALEVFPDCDIQFLRERVLKYPFAHIEQVTDELLRLGHWPERLNYGQIEDADGIRSERYKHQALKQLVKEFPEARKKNFYVCVSLTTRLHSLRFGNHLFKLCSQRTIGTISRVVISFNVWVLVDFGTQSRIF